MFSLVRPRPETGILGSILGSNKASEKADKTKLSDTESIEFFLVRDNFGTSERAGIWLIFRVSDTRQSF